MIELIGWTYLGCVAFTLVYLAGAPRKEHSVSGWRAVPIIIAYLPYTALMMLWGRAHFTRTKGERSRGVEVEFREWRG